ncbi:WD40 repeat-like protein, partial [Aureobasidium melanogenum]
MEAAIRWSPLSSPDEARFLLADVAGNALTLYQTQSLNRHGIQYKPIARREKVNNFTAFDWSRTDDSLVALGLSSGNAELYRFDDSASSDPVALFNIKTQRRCNTIAFNTQNLLAVGLDRVRHDNCLTVYDIQSNEAYSRLCVSEAVTSLRFFPNHPQQMLAAVSRQTIRLYDLRDSSTTTAGLGNCGITKLVNNIAIDPLDENYFASGGSTGDPSVTVWDKRYLSRSNSATGPDAINNGAVLDLRPATDNNQTTSVWSIRYSGQKRGRFCVLSSTGEVKLYDTAQHKVHSKLRPASVNYYGGNPWTHPHYVARTHSLREPESSPRKDRTSNRVIAFDWISTDDRGSQAILALHPNRDVDLI